MKPKLISGGALGSDLAWTKTALRYGMAVEIISFEGHNRNLPGPDTTIIEVPQETLNSWDPELFTASRNLNKKLPQPGYKKNLLLRNVHLAHHNSVRLAFAIADLVWADPIHASVVEGGTGWTVSCLLDVLFSENYLLEEVYVYSPGKLSWFVWDSYWDGFVFYEGIPNFRGVGEGEAVIGIGSRDLGYGLKAILSVFEETFG